jgi:hypothetical protein
MEINHSTYLRKGLGLLENPSKSAYTMKGIRSEFIKDSAECFDHLKDCLNNLAREGKTLIFTKGGNELSWIADLKARGKIERPENILGIDLEHLKFPTASDLRVAYKVKSKFSQCRAHAEADNVHCSSEECGLFMRVIELNPEKIITEALAEIARRGGSNLISCSGGESDSDHNTTDSDVDIIDIIPCTRSEKQ